MNILESIKQWEQVDGPELFLAMGVKDGEHVLDFGFGAGQFSVAASRAVGKTGKVTAIDCGPASVEGLRNRIRDETLANIEVIHTDGGTKIPLPDCTVDCLLLYDILHFEELDKPALICEAYRVLRPGGMLSALPFHMSGDEIKALNNQIVAVGFGGPDAVPDAGPHIGRLAAAYQDYELTDFGSIPKGTILNFIKQ